MTLRLEDLDAQAYAQRVLPLTHSLWGGSTTFDAYAQRIHAMASSAYGKAFFKTIGIFEGSAEPLASFKRYEREARANKDRLRAMGIGAVFTPEESRGRGYATAMLAMALDAARDEGFDFAYLFSDIHPQFYRPLGFSELSSRSISLRVDLLGAGKVNAERITANHLRAVAECFAATEDRRAFGLVRSPGVWQTIAHRAGIDGGDVNDVNVMVRDGKRVAAYLFGVREPKHDAYVVDEFGFLDSKAAELIAPLLRYGAGDLQRITGWLPPAPARGMLPRGSVRKRSKAILMIAPLGDRGKRFLDLASATGCADPIWVSDHV